MKPIIFNTDMVSAILGGRKNQTRRVVKPIPQGTGKFCELKTQPGYWNMWGNDYIYRQPCKPGDILYVRETWGCYTESWLDAPKFEYRASFVPEMTDLGATEPPKWRPAIHMPKEAARIFLRVTSVRCEHLKAIDGYQAREEGIRALRGENGKTHYYVGCDTQRLFDGPVGAFAHLWDSTVKPDKLPLCGWEANPWVWVISFERCEKEDVSL